MKFCVYLTCYRGNKLPPFYVGSSTVAQIRRGYHGSVKSKKYGAVWKSETDTNADLFVTKIVALCETRQEAFDLEERLHRKLNVIKNPLYANQTIANRRFYNPHGHSTETYKKIADKLRGRKAPARTQEWRDRQVAAKLGKKMGPNRQRTPEEIVRYRAKTCKPITINGVEFASRGEANAIFGRHYVRVASKETAKS